jgi:hypothetical protein
MTRALCKGAVAFALFVSVLTIVPVAAEDNPNSPSLRSVPGDMAAPESRRMLHLALKAHLTGLAQEVHITFSNLPKSAT